MNEETKISKTYLSKLEHDRIETPVPQNLYKLVESYQVTYKLMMDFTGYLIPKAQSEKSRFSIDTFATHIHLGTKDEAEALVEYLQFIRS